MKKTSIITTVIAIAAILAISAPFFSFAAGTTLTVQTNASIYPTAQAGTHVIISGTVSPAPSQTGYSVTLEINTTQGLLAVYSTPVAATTGAYSYTLVTGYAANGWINGTYTINAVYAASSGGPTYTASTTFQYGGSTTPTSTTSTSSVSTTTVTSTVTATTTVSTTLTQPTTVTSSTTVVSTSTLPGTTVTVTGPTVTSTTTSISSNGTDLGIGIAGVIAAVIVAGASAFLLRRR